MSLGRPEITRRLRETIGCSAPLIVFFAAWELISYWMGADILPSVLDICSLLITHALSDPIIQSQGGGEYGFLPHVGITIIRVVVGMSVGASIGAVIAMLLFQCPPFRHAIEPLLEWLRVIPPLILIPFVLIVLGPTEIAQTTVCAIYAGLSMLVHTLHAVANLPREFWIIARTHRASRWQTIQTMVFPAALPQMLGGIRISLALALGIVIVAEYLGASTGLGRVLKFAVSFARVDLILVGVVWAALVGLLFDTILNRIITARNYWLA